MDVSDDDRIPAVYDGLQQGARVSMDQSEQHDPRSPTTAGAFEQAAVDGKASLEHATIHSGDDPHNDNAAPPWEESRALVVLCTMVGTTPALMYERHKDPMFALCAVLVSLIASHFLTLFTFVWGTNHDTLYVAGAVCHVALGCVNIAILLRMRPADAKRSRVCFVLNAVGTSALLGVYLRAVAEDLPKVPYRNRTIHFAVCAAQGFFLHILSIFMLPNMMVAHNASRWACLWDAAVTSVRMVDSMTSLAFAAQIYYPAKAGDCPYDGRSDCGEHWKLFILIITAAVADILISTAMTLAKAVTGKRVLTALHVCNLVTESILLTASSLASVHRMTTLLPGGSQFVIFSAMFTVTSFIGSILGARRVLLAIRGGARKVSGAMRKSLPGTLSLNSAGSKVLPCGANSEVSTSGSFVTPPQQFASQ